jgi:hypothetical protein
VRLKDVGVNVREVVGGHRRGEVRGICSTLVRAWICRLFHTHIVTNIVCAEIYVNIDLCLFVLGLFL